MYIKINEATNYIKTQYHGKIDLAIILGSGLGPLADEIENPIELDYRDIPHFPISNLIGHAGKLIIGTLENKTVIAMKGRFIIMKAMTWILLHCQFVYLKDWELII